MKTICRLCLIKCDDFAVIDENTKNDLDILLLKINLFVSEEPVICTTCAEIVKKCLNFKTMCLAARDNIVSFIYNESNAKIDLKKLYMNKKEDVSGISEDCSICGLCMSVVESCSAVCLDDGDNMMMLGKCLPELDLSIIEKPVIGASCVGSLQDYFHFAINCLEVEEKIKKYCDSLNIINEKCLIDLSGVLQFTLTSKDDNTVDIIKEEFCMDQETVDQLIEMKNEHFIEVEDHPQLANVVCTSRNLLICKDEDTKADINETVGKCYTELANKITQNNEDFVKMEDHKFLHNEDIDIKTEQLDINRFQDGDAEPSSNHTLTHENVSHLQRCKDPLEIPVYQWDYCSYHTKEMNESTIVDNRKIMEQISEPSTSSKKNLSEKKEEIARRFQVILNKTETEAEFEALEKLMTSIEPALAAVSQGINKSFEQVEKKINIGVPVDKKIIL